MASSGSVVVGAPSSSSSKKPKRFKIKKWNTVSLWAWGQLGFKMCSIKTRESEFPELWVSRNKSILNKLLEIKSSICLQEFWVGNEELVKMYENRLGEAGYRTYKLARTNNHGDGWSSDIKCGRWQIIYTLVRKVHPETMQLKDGSKTSHTWKPSFIFFVSYIGRIVKLV